MLRIFEAQYSNVWCKARWQLVGIAATLTCLTGCSPKYLIVQGVANELAAQGKAAEEDLVLAREASAFYLKLSEALLREVPDNIGLSESVAAGFTQYAYAFVSLEADRIESKDIRMAQSLRERAARLYLRAHTHAMASLARTYPHLRQSLQSAHPEQWPPLESAHIGLAYWAAASWGGYIALSTDSPDIVADLPLAIRLATLAYARSPHYGQGALASLMGTFETSRPGGSSEQALTYFDQAIALGDGRSAGAFVAKAEGIALPKGDRAIFEMLLHKALAASKTHPGLQNAVMRERATWMLSQADDLF
jgi:hypothetical protein